MKIKLLKLTALSTLCITGIISTASAKELTAEQDFEYALKALPELADDLESNNANKSSATQMKCYVDTLAYDLFTYNYCFSAAWPRTTTAVFAIDNVPAGSTINWSNSNCNANNSVCFVPIRQYQSITVNATVLKPNGTYSSVSATAEYEGLF